jgi:hypothetical protein
MILTAKASMFHFQCIVWSETCCGKTAEATENSQIFQLMSVFQRSVTHSRVAHVAHQAVTIEAGVCCARVRNFSILAGIVLAIALIYKIV